MKFRFLTPVVLTGLVSLGVCLASSDAVMSEKKNCAADAHKELSLPNGFCATIFADKVVTRVSSPWRHIVFADGFASRL
jgi:hypothetical protein